MSNKRKGTRNKSTVDEFLNHISILTETRSILEREGLTILEIAVLFKCFGKGLEFEKSLEVENEQ